MSFRIPCPQCGERSVYEFRFGGEYTKRPQSGADEDEWYQYNFLRRNEMGSQTEWWYHRLGCRQWLRAVRETRTNKVIRAYFPDEAEQTDRGPGES